MERLPGPFFEAGAPLPSPHQHPSLHPHTQQPFFHPLPPPSSSSSSSCLPGEALLQGEICEHETSIDLSAYLDPGAFHDEFLAELFQQQRGQQPPYPQPHCKEAMPAPHAAFPAPYGGLYAEKGFQGGYEMRPVRVKQEPHEDDDDEEEEDEEEGESSLAPLYSQAARCAQTTVLLLQQPTPPPTPAPSPLLQPPQPLLHPHQHPLLQPPPPPPPLPPRSGSKKALDKGSREYRLRRERNNVAVRKSRDKAKLRNAETQQKVLQLSGDNDRLRKRVEQLGRELQALRGVLRHLPDGQLLKAMGGRA